MARFNNFLPTQLFMPGEIFTATRKNFYVDGHARARCRDAPALGDMVQEERRDNTNEWIRKSLEKDGKVKIRIRNCVRKGACFECPFVKAPDDVGTDGKI